MTTLATIRPAVPLDAKELTDLALRSKRHWGYPESWLVAWRDALRITPDYVASQSVFCAVDERDQIIGFYALESDRNRLQLDHLWLTPGFIGSGLGRQLFEHAVQTARAQGATEFFIEADPNAEGFYQHMGAERIGANVSRLTGEERVLPLLRYYLKSDASRS
jgi:GNAT superfamily N-acetyltransferase